MAIITDSNDMNNLRESCRILMSCYHHLGNMLKPGITAKELDDFAIDFIKSNGGRPSFLGYDGFKYALCTSIGNEVVHGISNSQKVIENNTIVSLDLGVEYKGMFSDSAQTYIVGEVDKRTQKLVQATKEGLMAGIKVLKPGKKVGDIGAAIDEVARKNRLGNVLELGGHGVGYGVHEKPFILNAGKPGKGATLFENQVIAIEPMFTLGGGAVDFDETEQDGWTVTTSDGSLSAHFEHTVLVTKKGYEILTQIEEKDLIK